MQYHKLTSTVLAIVSLAALSACGEAPPSDIAADPQAIHEGRGPYLHGVPFRDPHAAAIRNGSAPAGAHLTYYGGRVNAATNVVIVLWGTGSYESHVSSSATPSMLTFYQQALGNGSYSSWLNSEYNTVNNSFNGTHTNQNIGTGTAAAPITITPSFTGTTVDDTNIQAELSAQANAGHIPAPAHDAAGNATTYYAVFFPPGITITQGGSSSCVAGGFCAYHGTVAAGGSLGEYYYGVHPDMQSGSGCFTGCGGSSVFGNYTSVASHEMTEMITDAEVGLATVFGPPLAWYDQTNGEIGDICNAQQGSYTACDGQTYTIQLEFSNAQNNCIAYNAPTCGNDFSLSVSPASQTVSAGSSAVTATYSVSTTVVRGNAQAVSLSLSGLNGGVTGSFNPASVTAGGSSTLTLVVPANAVSSTSNVTVTGTGASATHTAGATLVVNGVGVQNPVQNPGFEASSTALTSWTASGSTGVSNVAHSGSHSAMVGSANPSNTSSIAQTFTIPAGGSTLSFWYRVVCTDTVQYDWATATLKDNTARTTKTILPRTCTNNGTWVQVSTSVTAGHSYTLTLTNRDDNYPGDPTYTLYDDVLVH